MVKRSEKGKESDLERIQDLFPSDNLRLYERDPLSPKKSLLRTKSVAATKLQRALSKSKLVSGETPTNSPSKDDSSSSTAKPKTEDIRTFIMDGHVQFTMGVQRQDRHLFLFNDVLLIAKSRSSGTYKLKEQVRVCELWLSTCLEDVSEAPKSADMSFVMGWPTTNVVATFSSPQIKEVWQEKLHRLITEAKDKEGSVLTTIQVTFRDHTCSREFCESVRVNNRHTARDCVRFVLDQLERQESETAEYQLWVKTGKDDAPYPLIGNEYPFCIKMNFVRELLMNSELELHNLKNVRTNLKCAFVLRNKSRKPSVFVVPKLKRGKKLRKPTLIHWPFRRQNSKQDTVDSGSSSSPGHFFGHSISKICSHGNLPKPILAILHQLFLKGPFTIGIFRKSANARVCRDLRHKLDLSPEYDPQNEPIHVLACVFKEFLRSLPDCLLQSSFYSEWLEAVTTKSGWECREHILSLLGRLPSANVLLLRYVLCVLWHIAQRSSENKMTPLNLAVCIGPSLLSPNIANQPASILHPEVCEVSKLVPKVVAYLIDHCSEIFGEECLQLFGDSPEKDPSRQDSGAEESDSVHSANGVGVGYRRDDSSIDSLERELLDESEPSPKLPSKNKMSLTNLSHDSGLTLSDTQLYTPDEEVDSEESSNGDNRRSGSHPLAKSVPHLDTAGLENNPGVFTLYGRSGISIDGSCNEVMRKRRQGLECPRSRYLVTGSGSVSYARSSSVYENINSHFPVQYSRSYSCGMPHTLLGRQNHDFESAQQMDCLNYNNSLQRADDSVVSTLARSASEESLLSKYSSHEAGKRPALHRKGRAPSPPQYDRVWTRKERGQSAPDERINLVRSRRVTPLPDRHAVWFAAHSRQSDWKRSQSTSRIDDIDHSHDSSTISLVSSDDSTPHVSRSNSKVQEFATCSHSDIYNVYQSPNRVSSVCSSSSETSQRSQLSCVSRNSYSSCRSRGSQTSHDSGKSQGSNVSRPPQPPSYQETMNRRMLHWTSATSSSTAQLTEQMIQEQTMLSAKARQLYEESVRKYNEQTALGQDTHHAVLVKVDSQDGVPEVAHSSLKHGNLQRTVSEGHPIRLRQLPPVHVTDAQLKRHPRLQSQKGTSPFSTGLSTMENTEDWRKEISWSVAQLRRMFSQHSRQNGYNSNFHPLPTHHNPSVESQPQVYNHLKSPSHSGEEYVTVVRIGLSGHPTHTMTLHKRSDSLDSANSGEESFV